MHLGLHGAMWYTLRSSSIQALTDARNANRTDEDEDEYQDEYQDEDEERYERCVVKRTNHNIRGITM